MTWEGLALTAVVFSVLTYVAMLAQTKQWRRSNWKSVYPHGRKRRAVVNPDPACLICDVPLLEGHEPWCSLAE